MSEGERLRLEMELEKLRLRLESLARERVSLWSRINGVKDKLAAKEPDYKPVK
jgi:hypothetical protein